MGIKFKVIDIMPIIEVQGTYKRFPMNLLEWLPSERLKAWIMRTSKSVIEKITGRLFIESRRGSKDKFVAGGSSYTTLIHRLLMTVLHYQADLENLLVLGVVNGIEWLTGFFAKFGTDRVADIMRTSELDSLRYFAG